MINYNNIGFAAGALISGYALNTALIASNKIFYGKENIKYENEINDVEESIRNLKFILNLKNICTN